MERVFAKCFRHLWVCRLARGANSSNCDARGHAGAFSSPRAPTVPGGPGTVQIGCLGCGAIVREFHGLDHEALGPTLTPGQAATSSRLLFDLRPVPPRETRCASAPIPRKRSPCPGPAQGPPRARARPAQGPLIFYGTARRILDSQGFGVLISLNLQNQGFGGPCCKT